MTKLCPVEKKMRALLDSRGIDFIMPERSGSDPTNLDFYLPAFDFYIEVKQFHSDRIASQLATVPERKSVLVLIGPDCVAAFERLCGAISGTNLT